MSEELLVRHCSPTLAGLKTGSVFTCPYTSKQETLAQIRDFNRRLVGKGLRVIPLRFTERNVLVYVYRPSHLQRDLQNDLATQLLLRHGYTDLRAPFCLSRLIERFRDSGEFPHELGLFLGYPPEDVCGFIENGACGHKCVGCWKVYGDVDAAQRTFEKYHKCTSVYCDQWEKGRPLERLTVKS